jgi:hypothetical protein
VTVPQEGQTKMAETAGISEARWETLLDLIESGKLIPIVGRRMSMVEAADGSRVPFQQAVAERLAKELGVDPLPPGWGLTELYRSTADKDAFNVDAFHPRLKRVLAGMKPHLEPLRKIAEITHFRIFLCTAIDGFLEQAVREVRGARGETVTTFTFAPGYENPRRPLGQPGEVCVYNLLGSRQTCPNWAVTVEGLVEFVLGLQSEKYRPDQLFDALKDRHLIAIGCQIPDWFGRFFLRSLRNGPISEQKGLNLLIEDSQDADAAFGRYLELFSKKSFVMPGDAFAFVDELNRRWKERVGDVEAPLPPPSPGPDLPAPPQQSGKVFISYSHDDRPAAQELYEFLRTQGVDVWKDDRDDALEKGVNWDNEIARQITDCACFVPLISRNTAGVKESYFWNEWNRALKRSMQMDSTTRRFIFPVLCEAGLPVPEQFGAVQWTGLADPSDREALARALRAEQRSLRKERR